jgi:hypothetical protein
MFGADLRAADAAAPYDFAGSGAHAADYSELCPSGQGHQDLGPGTNIRRYGYGLCVTCVPIGTSFPESFLFHITIK